MNWPEYPGVRVCLSFIVGIAMGSFVKVPVLPSIAILIIAATFLLYKDHESALDDFYVNLLSTLLLLIGFSAGLARTSLQVYDQDAYHYSRFKSEKIDTVLGTVLEDIKRKTSLKTTIEVNQLNGIATRGKLLIYLPSSDSLLYLKPGDRIAFASRVYPTKKNSNPYAFDYKSYLKNRGIDFQAYLRSGSYHLLGYQRLSYIQEVTYDLRARALKILEERLYTTDQLATASAMILGYRDHISEDLYNAYATTGSVHVLAVSGLHVGIICMIFIFLFSKIKNETLPVRLIKAGVLISIVWFYAILTGAAPAVIRAGVMFTIMIIGRYWFDNQNIYNSLAFSAVLLLLYDPFLLYQASFQFSYLALLGIIFFHKLIYPIFEFRFSILDKIWNLGVVAFAAQTLVFPVTVYYFHKFPLYFIISGIISVWIAFFILTIGIAVIAFSWVPILGDVLAFILRFVIDIFMYCIYLIRDLPMSNLSGLWLSKSSTVLIYVSVISIMFMIYSKQKWKFIYSLGMAIVLLIGNNTYANYRTANQSMLTVYEVSRGSIIDIFDGNTCYTMSSETLTTSSQKFTTDNNRISSLIREVKNLKEHPSYQDHLIQINGKVIWIPTEASKPITIPQRSDILMITNGNDLYPTHLLDCHDTELVIVDKSISWKRLKSWKYFTKKYGIKLHNLREDGAYILE